MDNCQPTVRFIFDVWPDDRLAPSARKTHAHRRTHTEAFEKVFKEPLELVYEISHNLVQAERHPDLGEVWVHRKGATRAFPAEHPALAGTPWFATGHPVLIPGSNRDYSNVLTPLPAAVHSAYSVNHGAGRMMGRKHAIRTLDQASINASFDERDILTNCRNNPVDEAPAAYKDFDEVLRSVRLAGLASEVARLEARFVIKDASEADD